MIVEETEAIDIEYITKVIRKKTVPQVLELTGEDVYSQVGQMYQVLKTVLRSDERKFAITEEENLSNYNRLKDAINKARGDVI